ncbi:MAG: Glutaredoxin protein [Gammaproteobacteria bacterium]|nr:Glutaredoxin protein [Gammaproteobacteria bacterium]
MNYLPGSLPSLIRGGLTVIFRCFLVAAFVLPMACAQTVTPAGESSAATCNSLEIFTRPGCPHCARAKEFLQQLHADYPAVQITEQVVPQDQQQLERLFRLTEQYGIARPGVPAFLICDNFFIGYDSDQTTGEQIKRMLDLTGATERTQRAQDVVETSWFGTISAGQLGLPLFTIAIGLIDGFNPCAMWVLLILLSLLVNLRSRKRLILIAGTFVLVSGAVYFAFMAAWLNVYFIIGFSRTIQMLVGMIALLIGAVHIKDFFAFHQGLSLSIPDSAKPGIYARMRRVIYAENLWAACIAVIAVAVLVNLVELLCTAGLPAVYTQVLAARDLPAWGYYGYLLLYNLAYIFDDTLMVTIAVITAANRGRALVEIAQRRRDIRTGNIIDPFPRSVAVVIGNASIKSENSLEASNRLIPCI